MKDNSLERGAEIGSEKKFVYLKDAPNLEQLADHPIPRNNIIESRTNGQRFTEQEGLDSLSNYLSEARLALSQYDEEEAKDLEDRLASIEENLAYIGEHEMQEAIHGIAGHMLQSAQEGKDVYIFVAGNRSEKYTSLRILEEIDIIVSNDRDLASKIKIATSSKSIPQKIVESKNESKIFIPDDFVISGTRMKGDILMMRSSLREAGFSQREMDEIIEGVAVAAPVREEEFNRKTLTESGNITSYYGVKENTGEGGRWRDYPGVHITGTHCSADYGFEATINAANRFLKAKGVDIQEPLPINIQRPYETTSTAYDAPYKDENLQKKWDILVKKYEI